MFGAVLQSEIDITIPSTTPAQQLLAWVVIGVGLLIVAWRLYDAHYAGLPARLKRAKADLRGARQDTSLGQTYLSADEAADAATVRDAARRVLDGDGSGDTRPRDAARSIRHELARTWVPYWVRIPQAARRVGALALLVAVLGLVAVSTEVLLGLFETTAPGLQPAKWPILAVTQTVAVATFAANAAQGVPVLGALWSMGFQFLIVAVSLLYPLWYVSATVLFAGAAGLAILDRRLSSEAGGRWVDGMPSPGAVARGGALAGFMLWAFTLAGVGLGRVVGSPQTGVRYGLGAAVGAAVVLLVVAVVAIHRNLVALPQFTGRWARASADERKYILVRGGTLTVAALVGPLVPVYAAVALTKLPRIVTAFLAADVGVQALVLLLGAGVAGVLAWQAREAWGDVQSALQITLARQQVRAFVVGTGVPIAVVGVTYAIVAGLSKSILLGVVVAIGAGLVARVALSLLTRVRYRMGLYDPRDAPARRIVLEGAPLETRDGDQQWYLRVNGSTELLHPDREQLLGDAAAVCDELVTDGEASKTVADWHADFAFDVGITDGDETEQKLVERPRKHLYHELREHGGRIPLERLDEKIGDVPEQFVDGLLWREEYERGTIRTTDQYIVLRDDPYAQSEGRPEWPSFGD